MIGDIPDIKARLKGYLPRSWFGDISPILDAILQGASYLLSYVYSFIGYAKLQTRIKTATDNWLDLIANDFFGNAISRKFNQSDSSFRAIILANLFREKTTRNAISQVVTSITENAPIIFEPSRPADTGGLGLNTYLGVNDKLGSFLTPYQCFVTVARPVNSGVANMAGLGSTSYGLDVVATLGGTQLQGSITDADIYAAIDAVKPAGCTVWVKLV